MSVPAPRDPSSQSTFNSSPATPRVGVSVQEPTDMSHEKLDNFIRDGASSFNQYGDMADATSRTYIKRAKRVDSTDLPLELEVQLP